LRRTTRPRQPQALQPARPAACARAVRAAPARPTSLAPSWKRERSAAKTNPALAVRAAPLQLRQARNALRTRRAGAQLARRQRLTQRHALVQQNCRLRRAAPRLLRASSALVQSNHCAAPVRARPATASFSGASVQAFWHARLRAAAALSRSPHPLRTTDTVAAAAAACTSDAEAYDGGRRQPPCVRISGEERALLHARRLLQREDCHGHALALASVSNTRALCPLAAASAARGAPPAARCAPRPRCSTVAHDAGGEGRRVTAQR
jgi:hypothetical protein